MQISTIFESVSHAIFRNAESRSANHYLPSAEHTSHYNGTFHHLAKKLYGDVDRHGPASKEALKSLAFDLLEKQDQLYSGHPGTKFSHKDVLMRVKNENKPEEIGESSKYARSPKTFFIKGNSLSLQ